MSIFEVAVLHNFKLREPHDAEVVQNTMSTVTIHYSQLLDSLYESVFSDRGFEQFLSDVLVAFRATSGGFYIQNIQTHELKDVCMHGGCEGEIPSYGSDSMGMASGLTINNLTKPNVAVTESVLDGRHKGNIFFYKADFVNEISTFIKVGNVMSIAFHVRNDDYLNFTLTRPEGSEDFTEEERQLLNKLCPHLLRAMEAKELVQASVLQNKLLLNSLDSLGMGLVLLCGKGEVIELNVAAEQIINADDGLTVKSNKINAYNVRANQTIEHAVSIQQRTLKSDWILVPRNSLNAPFQVLVIHHHNPRMSSFNDAGVATMVILIDPARKRRVSRDLLQEYFRLTDREADVAQLLIQGYPAKKIASEAGMSYESARWYIKKLCGKSRASSQTEFISKVLSELSLSVISSGS